MCVWGTSPFLDTNIKQSDIVCLWNLNSPPPDSLKLFFSSSITFYNTKQIPFYRLFDFSSFSFLIGHFKFAPCFLNLATIRLLAPTFISLIHFAQMYFTTRSTIYLWSTFEEYKKKCKLRDFIATTQMTRLLSVINADKPVAYQLVCCLLALLTQKSQYIINSNNGNKSSV